MAAPARTHVALLRAVNLGGHNRVPMPLFRDAVVSLGHQDVVTYLQSGNAAFAAATARADDGTIARSLEAAVAERTGVSTAVIVLGRSELARVVRGNPFPVVQDHRLLHAVFLDGPVDEPGAASVAEAVRRSHEKGSRDDARVAGSAIYVHTPDGFGRSVLRRELDRGGVNRTPVRDGTARNWATVTALARLVGHRIPT